ncbi:hypothetical protein [Streptomyces sp. NPDC004629]|uniref:hypothetical protein n=1 Tax=Streptomyces sp. NPDC004629 TaxID=3364705 RepID=UPI00369519B0
MKFHERAVRELINDLVPESNENLMTATRLIEFMSTHNVFGALGVTDVWLASDGPSAHRLEVNIRGWGVYQSTPLSPKTAPWLKAHQLGAKLDLRAAAEGVYRIVARVVESVGLDAEEYLHDAIATYRVEVGHTGGGTTVLLGGPRAKEALVIAMGALSVAAAELGLDCVPAEARQQLEENGAYDIGPVSVSISHGVILGPGPVLKRRPVVAAVDRFLH